jgi:hypothetical protein
LPAVNDAAPVNFLNDYRDHIVPFFDFYKKFDYKRFGICVNTGKKHLIEREKLLLYQTLCA